MHKPHKQKQTVQKIETIQTIPSGLTNKFFHRSEASNGRLLLHLQLAWLDLTWNNMNEKTKSLEHKNNDGVYI